MKLMPPQYTSRLSRRPRKHSNEIRRYRVQLGLTQRALAASLGVGITTISAWERGLTCPTTPLLLKLAKALNTLTEHLYRDYFWPAEKQVPANSPHL
jgi:DNA-binding XRE family transcriptional regulator